MLPNVWNVAEPLEVEYRRPIHQSSNQSNSGRREIVKPPCGEETEGQESRSRRDYPGKPRIIIELRENIREDTRPITRCICKGVMADFTLRLNLSMAFQKGHLAYVL